MNTFYMDTRVEESSIWKGELNHYVPKDQLYNIFNTCIYFQWAHLESQIFLDGFKNTSLCVDHCRKFSDQQCPEYLNNNLSQMILWNHSFYSSLDQHFSLLTQENSSDTQGSYKVYSDASVKRWLHAHWKQIYASLLLMTFLLYG